MSTSTDSRTQARNRRREMLIGLSVMILVTAAGLWFVLSKAGDWGVPGFSYTNEHGSTCENGWISDTCTELTPEEVGHSLGVTLPAGSEVLSGTRVSGNNTTLVANVRIPAAGAPELRTALIATYGECRTDLPHPGIAERMPTPCILANDQYATESMSLRYTIALGTREGDTDPVLAMDILWR